MNDKEKRYDLEERRQLFRAGLWAGGALVIAMALLYAALWLPFREPAKSAVTELEEIRRLPPRPSRPGKEESGQPGYVWVDRGAGIVTLPLQEAMRAEAERLPVREGAARAREKRAAREVPTDAGSGRYPQRRRKH